MTWTKWNGTILEKRVENAIEKGIDHTLNQIHSQSLQEVPHDEGYLSQSIITRAKGKEGFISAGGGGGTGFPRVPYAVKWHEKSANFQKGRKKNYIRDPLNQVGSKNLAKNIQRELKSVI